MGNFVVARAERSSCPPPSSSTIERHLVLESLRGSEVSRPLALTTWGHSGGLVPVGEAGDVFHEDCVGAARVAEALARDAEAFHAADAVLDLDAGA
jgi:hypothetical protein